jgi:N-terminal acetyltransferase B complex non-catalytic subunit
MAFLLAADQVWSMAHDQQVLVYNDERLLRTMCTENPETLLTDYSRDWFMADLCISLMGSCIELLNGEKNSPEDVEQVTSCVRHLGALDLLARERGSVSTEHLALHYLLVDVLRNVVATCRKLRAEDDSAYEDGWTLSIAKLEKTAKQDLEKLKRHAEERRAEPKAEAVRRLIESQQAVDAEMVKLGGEEELMAFYEDVAEAAAEGWEGVTRIKDIV